MSLINQVLQDLERRHASEPELQSMPSHVRAVAGRKHGSPIAKAVAAAAIVAAIIAAALFFYGRSQAPPWPNVAAAPSPAPTVSVPVAKAPTPAAEPVAEAEPRFALASKLSGALSFVPEIPAQKTAPTQAASAPKPAKTVSAPVTERVAAPEPLREASEPPREAEVAVPAAPAQAAPAQAVPAPTPPEVAQAAPIPAPAESSSSSIDKQMREMTPQQRAETAFRKGVEQLRDARAAAAEASFREALREDQTHVAARQALLGLLLDARRNDEAEKLLRATLALNPRQPRHAMVLARLQVDRGEVPGAVNTLVGTLPHVQNDPEYYAFLAALLQREGRHKETVDYYRAALRSSPGNALWLMGLGISLRATSQFAEARESFQRAMETRQLGGDLAAFTERQLKELNAGK
jgi:MSHA biogenesis protein MshN